MNPRLQELIDRVRAIELTPRQQRIATLAGYPLFALFVAAVTFFTSVPRERVKDRIETALGAEVGSGQPLAIGMDVTIGDLSLTLFSGAGFVAKDIVLRSRPLAQGEKPARYIIDDARIRVGLFGMMFARPSYSFRVHALKGTVRGKSSASGDESKVLVELDKLVLTGAPGIGQVAGGLPIEGTVSGKLDVVVPKTLLVNTNGSIDLVVDDAAIGDGKAKLTVPNDPFLSAGLTFPRIRLGKIQGQIQIEKGRGRFVGVSTHSADGDAELEGYIELRDPFGSSQLHAYIKFRPSDALAKREPTVELMTSALATAKRNDGFFGLQITGPLSALYYLPSKEPPFGVTSRDGPAKLTPSPMPAPPVAPPPGAFAAPPNVPTTPPPAPTPPPPEPAAPAPPPPPPPSTPQPGVSPYEGGRGDTAVPPPSAPPPPPAPKEIPPTTPGGARHPAGEPEVPPRNE